MAESKTLPDYDDLPSVRGMPRGCAWGVFDKEGKKDLLGTLNLLTPEVVKSAAAEIKDGVSISLNLPINLLDSVPIPGRKKSTHRVATLQEIGLSTGEGFDDELDFNTQCCTQWDSLVHWQHQPTGFAYNGIKPTKEALSVTSTAENEMPTLDHWHARGGLVGRGVLIDYKEYAAAKGIKYNAVDGYRITVEDIENVAKHQGVEFKTGDIFLIRTGFADALLEEHPGLVFSKLTVGLVGVHGSEEVAKWFWNKHFAAVASDTPAFEAFPPLKEDGTPDGQDGLVLHPYFLSLFGMPIGEYFNLKQLGEYCKKVGRYTFMLSSSPLNMPGLVGSPPNALAIL
ncbi:unnamed protein product [Parascedosporium putredinis]|uniref:Cyclase n=1 Tax=Parascedosporium putredinis TaxID=1442378 RepID=A0A9P1H0S1_9PEZI|nr:unnamed protein product [Parascedosporium putredinis]CAI7992377.1 unnamed protein product [Parascedosporium putredinis]